MYYVFADKQLRNNFFCELQNFLLKLAAKIKSRIFVDENLVLTGLNRILQENAKI